MGRRKASEAFDNGVFFTYIYRKSSDAIDSIGDLHGVLSGQWNTCGTRVPLTPLVGMIAWERACAARQFLVDSETMP